MQSLKTNQPTMKKVSNRVVRPKMTFSKYCERKEIEPSDDALLEYKRKVETGEIGVRVEYVFEP